MKLSGSCCCFACRVAERRAQLVADLDRAEADDKSAALERWRSRRDSGSLGRLGSSDRDKDKDNRDKDRERDRDKDKEKERDRERVSMEVGVPCSMFASKGLIAQDSVVLHEGLQSDLAKCDL